MMIIALHILRDVLEWPDTYTKKALAKQVLFFNLSYLCWQYK